LPYISDSRLIDESSVLVALETAVSACAGWRAGSLPSQLDESEIDCICALAAATSSNDDTLLCSLLHRHQLVEKLASLQ
jgi:hypothetical protein